MKRWFAFTLAILLLFTTASAAMTVKNGGVTLCYENTASDSVTGVFMAVMSCDSTVQSVKLSETLTVPAGEEVSVTFSFEGYPSGAEVEGFFWNSLEGIQPLDVKTELFAGVVDESTYTGDYLLAVNADIDASLSTGTLPSANVSADQQMNLAEYEEEEIYQLHREPVMLFPEQSAETGRNINASVSSVSYAVGDTRSFLVEALVPGITDPEYSLEFTLKAVGDHCYIWVATEDIDHDGYVYEKSSDEIVTTEMAEEIAAEYDNVIKPLLENNFGELTDYDGDPRFSLIFYDIQDGFTTSGSYYGGYFASYDLFTKAQADWANGNATDMMHIDTYPQLEKKGLYTTLSTVVHELQHDVNYHWVDINQPSYDGAVWTPFNEMMSMAAEHLYQGGALSERITHYNSSNYGSLIGAGQTFLDWGSSQDLADYALSYLFGQYLRTQTQGVTGGGTAIYRSIMDGLTNFSYTGVVNAFNRVMFGEDISGILKYWTREEMTANFRLALVLKDDYGPFGFHGESAFDALKLHTYSGTGTTLEPGGAVLIKNNGSFTPTVSDTKMWFYGITLAE